MVNPRGKLRTREHVIADLSVNHVERFALQCGHTVKRTTPDYGIDAEVTTFNEKGEIEPGNILLQLKATDKLKRLGNEVLCRIERENLVYWLAEPLPVILILYDADHDVAYWLYIQSHFRSRGDFNIFTAGKTISVRVPKKNVLNINAIKKFTRFRNRIREQIGEVIHDEDESDSLR